MQIQDQKSVFFRPKWELKPKGQPHPARRWSHTATNYGSHLYILGGKLIESAKCKEYVYKINCETFQCEQINFSDSPMMRQSHSCSLINDSMFVLFGMNKCSKVLNDCLQLKIGSNGLTCQIKQQKPEIQSRQSHMSVILDQRYILIYGGMNGDEKLINDFYIFDSYQQSWKKIAHVTGDIQVKVGGALISIKNQIYLFGGQKNDQNQYSNQIYKIQIKNYGDAVKDQTAQIIIKKLDIIGSRPLARSQFASAIYKNRFLIIVGGQSISINKQNPTLMNDIWAFDTIKQQWQQIIPQNASIFKPRSSFTATVYKQNLIVFGGLVSFKDFKTSDQLFVLSFKNQVQKKPICHICKSSFQIIAKPQLQIQKPKAQFHEYKFSTGFSTIFAVSDTIEHAFVGIGTLLHSFSPFKTQKCVISLDECKLMLRFKNCSINDNEWKQLLTSYEYSPLIQSNDKRIQKALKLQIRKNIVHYLAYNIKNCCFRLGKQFLISWINQQNELQICMMNRFGIFQSSKLNQSSLAYPSHASIIFQFMQQNKIKQQYLLHNQMTICIGSLKYSKQDYTNKQLTFDIDSYDILSQRKERFSQFLNIYFAQNLSFQIFISKQESFNFIDDNFKNVKNQSTNYQKWPHQIESVQYFYKILTYQTQQCSKMFIYQNNRLMHKKILKGDSKTSYQFHLSNKIEQNLTFSDVQPTEGLLKSIKSFIQQCKENSFKRSLPVDCSDICEVNNSSIIDGQFNSIVKKALKTNQCEDNLQNQENFVNHQNNGFKHG